MKKQIPIIKEDDDRYTVILYRKDWDEYPSIDYAKIKTAESKFDESTKQNRYKRVNFTSWLWELYTDLDRSANLTPDIGFPHISTRQKTTFRTKNVPTDLYLTFKNKETAEDFFKNLFGDAYFSTNYEISMRPCIHTVELGVNKETQELNISYLDKDKAIAEAIRDALELVYGKVIFSKLDNKFTAKIPVGRQASKYQELVEQMQRALAMLSSKNEIPDTKKQIKDLLKSHSSLKKVDAILQNLEDALNAIPALTAKTDGSKKVSAFATNPTNTAPTAKSSTMPKVYIYKSKNNDNFNLTFKQEDWQKIDPNTVQEQYRADLMRSPSESLNWLHDAFIDLGLDLSSTQKNEKILDIPKNEDGKTLKIKEISLVFDTIEAAKNHLAKILTVQPSYVEANLPPTPEKKAATLNKAKAADKPKYSSFVEDPEPIGDERPNKFENLVYAAPDSVTLEYEQASDKNGRFCVSVADELTYSFTPATSFGFTQPQLTEDLNKIQNRIPLLKLPTDPRSHLRAKKLENQANAYVAALLLAFDQERIRDKEDASKTTAGKAEIDFLNRAKLSALPTIDDKLQLYFNDLEDARKFFTAIVNSKTTVDFVLKQPEIVDGKLANATKRTKEAATAQPETNAFPGGISILERKAQRSTPQDLSAVPTNTADSSEPIKRRGTSVFENPNPMMVFKTGSDQGGYYVLLDQDSPIRLPALKEELFNRMDENTKLKVDGQYKKIGFDAWISAKLTTMLRGYGVPLNCDTTGIIPVGNKLYFNDLTHAESFFKEIFTTEQKFKLKDVKQTESIDSTASSVSEPERTRMSSDAREALGSSIKVKQPGKLTSKSTITTIQEVEQDKRRVTYVSFDPPLPTATIEKINAELISKIGAAPQLQAADRTAANIPVKYEFKDKTAATLDDIAVLLDILINEKIYSGTKQDINFVSNAKGGDTAFEDVVRQRHLKFVDRNKESAKQTGINTAQVVHKLDITHEPNDTWTVILKPEDWKNFPKTKNLNTVMIGDESAAIESSRKKGFIAFMKHITDRTLVTLDQKNFPFAFSLSRSSPDQLNLSFKNKSDAQKFFGSVLDEQFIINAVAPPIPKRPNRPSPKNALSPASRTTAQPSNGEVAEIKLKMELENNRPVVLLQSEDWKKFPQIKDLALTTINENESKALEASRREGFIPFMQYITDRTKIALSSETFPFEFSMSKDQNKLEIYFKSKDDAAKFFGNIFINSVKVIPPKPLSANPKKQPTASSISTPEQKIMTDLNKKPLSRPILLHGNKEANGQFSIALKDSDWQEFPELRNTKFSEFTKPEPNEKFPTWLKRVLGDTKSLKDSDLPVVDGNQSDALKINFKNIDEAKAFFKDLLIASVTVLPLNPISKLKTNEPAATSIVEGSSSTILEKPMASTTNPPPKYDSIDWNISTGEGNLCGFASFIPLIDRIIKEPDLYYGKDSAKNAFVEKYEKALKAAKQSHTKANEAQRAQAIKVAFVNTMRATPIPSIPDAVSSPLETLFGLTFIQGLDKDSTEKELKDSIVKEFLNNNRSKLQKLYNNFKGGTHDQDGAAFLKFIALNDKKFLSDSIKFFCDKFVAPKTNYAARDTDLTFIASSLGVRTLTIYSEQDGFKPIQQNLNANGNVDMALRNQGFHWEPALLSVPELVDTSIYTDKPTSISTESKAPATSFEKPAASTTAPPTSNTTTEPTVLVDESAANAVGSSKTTAPSAPVVKPAASTTLQSTPNTTAAPDASVYKPAASEPSASSNTATPVTPSGKPVKSVTFNEPNTRSTEPYTSSTTTTDATSTTAPTTTSVPPITIPTQIHDDKIDSFTPVSTPSSTRSSTGSFSSDSDDDSYTQAASTVGSKSLPTQMTITTTAHQTPPKTTAPQTPPTHKEAGLTFSSRMPVRTSKTFADGIAEYFEDYNSEVLGTGKEVKIDHNRGEETATIARGNNLMMQIDAANNIVNVKHNGEDIVWKATFTELVKTKRDCAFKFNQISGGLSIQDLASRMVKTLNVLASDDAMKHELLKMSFNFKNDTATCDAVLNALQQNGTPGVLDLFGLAKDQDDNIYKVQLDKTDPNYTVTLNNQNLFTIKALDLLTSMSIDKPAVEVQSPARHDPEFKQELTRLYEKASQPSPEEDQPNPDGTPPKKTQP